MPGRRERSKREAHFLETVKDSLTVLHQEVADVKASIKLLHASQDAALLVKSIAPDYDDLVGSDQFLTDPAIILAVKSTNACTAYEQFITPPSQFIPFSGVRWNLDAPIFTPGDKALGVQSEGEALHCGSGDSYFRDACYEPYMPGQEQGVYDGGICQSASHVQMHHANRHWTDSLDVDVLDELLTHDPSIFDVMKCPNKLLHLLYDHQSQVDQDDNHTIGFRNTCRDICATNVVPPGIQLDCDNFSFGLDESDLEEDPVSIQDSPMSAHDGDVVDVSDMLDSCEANFLGDDEHCHADEPQDGACIAITSATRLVLRAHQCCYSAMLLLKLVAACALSAPRRITTYCCELHALSSAVLQKIAMSVLCPLANFFRQICALLHQGRSGIRFCWFQGNPWTLHLKAFFHAMRQPMHLFDGVYGKLYSIGHLCCNVCRVLYCIGVWFALIRYDYFDAVAITMVFLAIGCAIYALIKWMLAASHWLVCWYNEQCIQGFHTYHMFNESAIVVKDDEFHIVQVGGIPSPHRLAVTNAKTRHANM